MRRGAHGEAALEDPPGSKPGHAHRVHRDELVALECWRRPSSHSADCACARAGTEKALGSQTSELWERSRWGVRAAVCVPQRRASNEHRSQHAVVVRPTPLASRGILNA